MNKKQATLQAKLETQRTGNKYQYRVVKCAHQTVLEFLNDIPPRPGWAIQLVTTKLKKH